MALFEETFRDYLIALNLVGGRVSLIRAPQIPAEKMVTPYMVFLPVAAFPMVTQHGPLDIVQHDYQISIFDPSQTRALAIAESVRLSLNTLHGTFGNVYFGSCFHVMQSPQWEQETKLVHIIQQYRIMYRLLPAVQPVVTPARKGVTHVTDTPSRAR